MINEKIRYRGIYMIDTGRDAGRIVEAILTDYKKQRTIDKMDDQFDQPNKDVIIGIIDNLMKIVYPGYFRDRTYKSYNPGNYIATLIEDVMYRLNRQIVKAEKLVAGAEAADEEKMEMSAYETTVEFMSRIPKVREYLESDLQATHEGDPAAKNFDEVILAYPGLFAITVFRLAHELFLLNVPLIPRIMTEYAHSRTGIDIHPGATVGKHFFIDHGTGIVIGETTIIGNNVKVYQGVTIGALSTRGGQRLKNVKRHPTIEDDVTIYAGASILGGKTVIGRGCVIGSNTFITKSVAPGMSVSIRQQELQMKDNSQKQNDSWNNEG